MSTGDFGSLNLGYHVGDDPALVTKNRRRLGLTAGYDPDTLVAAQQVHGTGIAWVGAADRGRGAFSWDAAIPDTDGLITREVGVPLAIQVADCAPVLIVDPVQRVLAVVHAGWRGAFGRIASKAAREMIECAGTQPADIHVGIGPTLCPACLEVGEEVADTVQSAFGPAVVLRGAAKPHLDIRGMITADLLQSGVIPNQIAAHPSCTRCHVHRFFSHRGQSGRAGRFALVAWWEPSAY